MEIAVVILVGLVVYFTLIRKKKKETVAVDTDVEYFYSDFEIALVEEVNNHRKSLGLQKLEVNSYMSQICLEHNTYMQKQGKSSHDNFQSRSETIMTNLKCVSVGENVAYNFSTPRATLHAWLQSPSHKENLENPKWNIMGISNFSKFSTNIFAQLEN